MTKILNAIYAWYQGEPAVAHYLGAIALTALAHYGIHLDANETALALTVLGGAATGLTRHKVVPAPTAVSNQSGAVSKEFVVLVVIGMCVLAATWHYLNIHAG